MTESKKNDTKRNKYSQKVIMGMLHHFLYWFVFFLQGSSAVATAYICFSKGICSCVLAGGESGS